MRARAPDGTARLALRAFRVLAAIAAAPVALCAQPDAPKPPVQFEMRADLLTAPSAGAQVGAGANIAAGYYLRVGLDAAGGADVKSGAATSGRADIVARYILDPFGEFRWGPYVGGGFTASWDRRAARRGDLLLLVGVEGPAHAGWRTSVELGLGGGARLGVVLRRARSNAR
jgi:hypothetical protein